MGCWAVSQSKSRPAILIKDVWIALLSATVRTLVCLSVQICDLKHPLATHSWLSNKDHTVAVK